MALTINTNIKNEANGYSLDASQVKGGYVVVANEAERNAIPAATKVNGTTIYQADVRKEYRWNGSKWLEASGLNIENGTGENSIQQKGATASYANMAAFGQYNLDHPNNIFEIGNGRENFPANAFSIDKKGRALITPHSLPLSDFEVAAGENLRQYLYSIEGSLNSNNLEQYLNKDHVGMYFITETDMWPDTKYWIENNFRIIEHSIVKVVEIIDSHSGQPTYFYKVVDIENRELYLTNGKGKCSIVKKAYGTDVTPKAIGYYSNIFSVDTDKGFGGQVTSKYTTLFGVNVRADSNSEGSIVGGRYCIADSAYTLMYGKSLTTQGSNETLSKVVLGYNNKFNTKAILEVGNGTDSIKSNAFEILKDGRVKVQTTPQDNDDVTRKGDFKTINGNSIIGSGDLTIAGSDSKLDKQTAQTESDQVYGKLADGSQTMFDVTMGATATTIPRRDTAGRIQVADGVSGNDAVNFNQLQAVVSILTQEQVDSLF